MSRPPFDEAVAWHDVECAAYEADLTVWRELAVRAGGPVLDLGCGTGRVALDLAARGHDVTAVDSDPALVRALVARARKRGLHVRAHSLDVRVLDLGCRFALAIAPMQVIQLMGGREPRLGVLRAVHRHLHPGGTLAASLADPLDGLPAGAVLPPIPDVREQAGWVLSSRPVAVRDENGALAIDRLREAVSPRGELSGSVVTVLLDRVTPPELEDEGIEAGYKARERITVPETPDYVGSTVVVLEAA